MFGSALHKAEQSNNNDNDSSVDEEVDREAHDLFLLTLWPKEATNDDDGNDPNSATFPAAAYDAVESDQVQDVEYNCADFDPNTNLSADWEDENSEHLDETNSDDAIYQAWEGYMVYDEGLLYDYAESRRLYDRACGISLARCTWALLDKPDVFGKNLGPQLVLTTPEGETKYPQDMRVYPGQSDWADLDDDDHDY